MELVSANIANISTTRTPEGGPYLRRQLVVEAVETNSFGAQLEGFMDQGHEDMILGARATEVRLDPSPPIMRYEPGHPHADGNGYVAYPNVNPAVEMVDMVGTSRSYEANVAAIRSAREMIGDTVELLKV
jgi:flagellar basal-body rod protein FlgC